MPLHGKNIIGFDLSAEGSDTFRALNPAGGEELDGEFHLATSEELDRALEAADRTFRSRVHGDPAQTAGMLDRIAQEMEALGDELVQRAVAETALPASRIKMERGRTCGQLRMFAELVREGSWVDARIDRAQPRRRPMPKPDLRRMLVPVGPVVVFPASNFPLAFSVAGGDTASALAAGCPVIVKARPQHPGTSELVGQAMQTALRACGMPDGWFSMIHGRGTEAGVYLVKHPITQAVGFTGSFGGGRALMQAAQSRPQPIPVYAEMGSINPVFLMPAALAQRAEAIAEGLYQSVTLGVGQFCTNPGLVLAPEGEALQRMLAILAERIAATAPATMLAPAIRDGYAEAVAYLAGAPGVERLCGSSAEPNPALNQAVPAVFATDADRFLMNAELGRECFGPATLVVRCANQERMTAVAHNLQGQLTASLHATDEELPLCTNLLSILERKAGRVLLNGFPTNVDVCPAMHHGGPYPSTSDTRSTSVGTAAILRFARPVCYQDFAPSILPPELRDRNERNILRQIDGHFTRDDVV